MGGGASSKQANGRVAAAPVEASGYSEKTVSPDKDWMIPRGEHQASSSSSSTAAAAGKRDEQEILWLRRMFDAEKAEKAWIMARIDGLEAQLKARSEECASLRSAALGARQAGRATPPPEQPAALQSPASKLQRSPSSPSRQVDPLSPSASLSLKERRGLKLEVATGKAPLAVSTSAAPSITISVAPAVSSGASLARADSSSEAPMVKRLSTHATAFPMEPMSPLLARRTQSGGLGRLSANLGTTSLTLSPSNKEMSKDQAIFGFDMSESKSEPSPKTTGSLGIDAFKMAQLEAPESPKRRKRPSMNFEVDMVPKNSLEKVPEDQLAQMEDLLQEEGFANATIGAKPNREKA